MPIVSEQAPAKKQKRRRKNAWWLWFLAAPPLLLLGLLIMLVTHPGHGYQVGPWVIVCMAGADNLSPQERAKLRRGLGRELMELPGGAWWSHHYDPPPDGKALTVGLEQSEYHVRIEPTPTAAGGFVQVGWSRYGVCFIWVEGRLRR